MAVVEYETGRGSSARRKSMALVFVSIAAPFFILPAFVLATVFLQDVMINGDGRSWVRAATWAGVPCAGAAALLMVAPAIWLLRRRQRAWVAWVAVVLDLGALGVIVWAVVTTSTR